MIPDNPDLAGVGRHGGLVNAGRAELGQERECLSAIRAQERHDVADTAVDVGEEEVAEGVPRQRGVADGGRTQSQVDAVGDRLARVRIDPRHTAIDTARGEHAGTRIIVAHDEELQLIGRIFSDSALALVPGHLRRIDVDPTRDLSVDGGSRE